MRLQVHIPADGQVNLRWTCEADLAWVAVLVQRTGAVPSHTAFHLDGSTREWGFARLSRHQRYRLALLAHDVDGRLRASDWWSLTPRAGVPARQEEGTPSGGEALAAVERLLCMPTEDRLKLWWDLSPGFTDELTVVLTLGQEIILQRKVAPDLKSLCLDLSEYLQRLQEKELTLRLQASFCGMAGGQAQSVRCVLAPQGQERQANAHLPQAGLVYASLSLEPELRIFDEDETEEPVPAPERPEMICGRCGAPLAWRSYRLTCQACHAAYIPNGRGDYLDVDRLRFGTCLCCQPARILIQALGSEQLVCAHSLKEHIRLPGERKLRLAQDLPYGLCQCCRPRKPLLKHGDEVRCSASDELHRQQQGRWVLVPSQTIFDAAAIDALLDAGMAEICAGGVSRAAPRADQTRRRRRRS